MTDHTVGFHGNGPQNIMFHGESGETILTIMHDGKLVRGAGFASDDTASVAFFDCLSRILPEYLSKMKATG